MAAIRPDPTKAGASGAMISTPDAQVIPRPGRYEIDTSCSAVTFRTRHLFGLAPVRGGFTIRAGTIDVTEPLADSSVCVQLDPASFRTGNGQRDDTVRSERLLELAST
jgi:polyisoprenoid-binding protein YceI